MMHLKDLLQKTPDADVLREMIGFAAERLMVLEISALTRAGFGEKSAEQMAARNGYPKADLLNDSNGKGFRMPAG